MEIRNQAITRRNLRLELSLRDSKDPNDFGDKEPFFHFGARKVRNGNTIKLQLDC